MAGSEQQASKICILALSALYFHFSVYSLATYKTKSIYLSMTQKYLITVQMSLF